MLPVDVSIRQTEQVVRVRVYQNQTERVISVGGERMVVLKLLIGGGGGGAATTCAQLSGTCMSPFSCTGRVAPTSDCTNNSERCCYAFAAPGATTHPSTCRHGDTVVQICGAGWIHGQILTPCVKKQTKVCVYGNWEVRRRCGESNPSCL